MLGQDRSVAGLRARTWRRAGIAAVAAVVLVAGACSSGGGDASAGGSPAGGAPGTSAGTTPGSLTRTASDPAPGTCVGPTDEVTATPVADSTSDYDITSFDGTVIRAHWFPVPGSSAADTKPVILMGPGWGLPGDTNVDAVGVLGALNIASLRDAGYHVLTWDPRGFGKSGGSAQVDSVDYEAKDVRQLLTWVTSQPEVETEGPGDPLAGMVGGSYGGGIQLVTGAIDCRVDALVPVIAWHSLGTSLYQDDTYKAGWAGILAQVSATAHVDPHVTSARDEGAATGVLSADNKQWFLDRGPGDLVGDITAPTLVVGGTVDTLFPLDEDITNYGILRDNGVPSAMFWFCGGHGVCLTDPGDPEPMQHAIIGWLDRYVKGDESVDTGARFTFLDQDGTHYTADDYPLAAGDEITASGSGTLDLTADGGAGPITLPAGDGGMLGSLVAPITPGRASNAVSVTIDAPAETAMVVGAPEVTLRYSGTVDAGDRPVRVFAQLVDDTTGVVVGNQITPIPVTLDGQRHEVTIPLEVIAQRLEPGTTLTLQLVATTTAYGQPRLGGSVTFDQIDVTLPTVTGYQPA